MSLLDYDMSNNYYLIADPNISKIPKLEANTIHAAGELARNPSDTSRPRSQFESALCVKDPLFAEKCYMMVEYDPHTYEYASYDTR